MTLRPMCSCGAALAALPLFRHAVDVRTRTCRRCRSRWVVKAEPLPSHRAGVLLHRLTLTRLAR